VHPAPPAMEEAKGTWDAAPAIAISVFFFLSFPRPRIIIEWDPGSLEISRHAVVSGLLFPSRTARGFGLWVGGRILGFTLWFQDAPWLEEELAKSVFGGLKCGDLGWLKTTLFFPSVLMDNFSERDVIIVNLCVYRVMGCSCSMDLIRAILCSSGSGDGLVPFSLSPITCSCYLLVNWSRLISLEILSLVMCVWSP
jgi:hypothetical protein